MLAANVNTLSLKRTTPHLASNAPAATTGPVIRFQAGRSVVDGEYAGTAAYAGISAGAAAAGGVGSTSSTQRVCSRNVSWTCRSRSSEPSAQAGEQIVLGYRTAGRIVHPDEALLAESLGEHALGQPGEERLAYL